MDKTKDKFCPQCGHHVYKLNDTEKMATGYPYYCAECSGVFDSNELLDINQADPLRQKFGGEK